jgi:acetyl esterase/lipase
VSVATLTAFPAGPPYEPRAAVIVCPGGAYARLPVANEGADVTRFLNALGVSAFVLKYRVAPYRYPAALRDVLRAVRFVRSNARELGVDPARIGVFGSSAGGHLAASAGTLFDSPEGKTGAALDAVSARPDFVALLYPVITMTAPYAHAGSRDALLGPRAPKDLVQKTSLELHVKKDTPPTFLVHTAEDRSVPLENSPLSISRSAERGSRPKCTSTRRDRTASDSEPISAPPPSGHSVSPNG